MKREELTRFKAEVGLDPYQKRLDGWERIGNEYKALCPWHEGDGSHHNPSLAVYPSKENDGEWLFTCWVCEKKSGDILKFVQLMDGLQFTEAIEQLANESHITLPEPVKVTYDCDKAIENLDKAKDYLESQGVPLALAKVRGVGYCDHPKLGPSIALQYDSDREVVKFRAINPKTKHEKFAHLRGHPSEDLLYNIESVKSRLSGFDDCVFVTESERDALTMEAHGFLAVSVSSASACLDKDGDLKIARTDLEKLNDAEYIFLTLDQDSAGQKCADAFERSDVFNVHKLKRILWSYGGKRSSDPKDVGDLYLQDPAGFRERIEQLMDEACSRPPKWRQQFKTIGELEDGGIQMLIEHFLPEGNIALGGLSGHGKTFLAMSIGRALTRQLPFLGKFRVPKVIPVLYLCPEVNGRQFKMRARLFGIPNDETLFLCRTMSDGTTLALDDPSVLEAVRQLKPAVILDTAIRFSRAKDENSAADNRWMEENARGLREVGAIAVIMLHHSPKSSADENPTLENTLRGTGDIGAIFDMVYNVRRDQVLYSNGEGPTQLTITCVKQRDFEPPKPFRIGMRYKDEAGMLHSFIEERGDLVLMGGDSQQEDLDVRFLRLVEADPRIGFRELKKALGKGDDYIKSMAHRLRWEKPDKRGPWQKAEQLPEPPELIAEAVELPF